MAILLPCSFEYDKSMFWEMIVINNKNESETKLRWTERKELIE